jgi:hypothetical protein
MHALRSRRLRRACVCGIHAAVACSGISGPRAAAPTSRYSANAVSVPLDSLDAPARALVTPFALS